MDQLEDDNAYMYPSLREFYNPEKALAYWLQSQSIDCIEGLGSSIYDALGRIRTVAEVLLFEWNKDKIVLQNNPVSLAEVAKPILRNCLAARETMQVMYYYQRNWSMKKELAKYGKSFNEKEIKFPDSVYHNYAAFFLGWYQHNPEDFLAIMVPLIESNLSQLSVSIRVLDDIPNLEPIQLFEDPKSTFTLKRASEEFSKEYMTISEEFFLLKSHANAHRN